MRFIGMSLGGLLVLSSPMQAQEFFFKSDSKSIEKVALNFEINDVREIRFEDPERLKSLTLRGRDIPGSWIKPREASDVEKLIDAGFAIFSALMVLSTHETYEINEDLKLSSIRGAIFLFFPFEDHFLYVTCKNDQHLVATTVNPSEDTLKRMKSLNEIRDLCSDEAQPKTSKEPA